jgi:transcriptional regulator with XRE-family HTH domain
MGSAAAQKPRVTEADPAFKDAVAVALKGYRDKERMKDAELADRLGVSTSALSKYMNCKQLIGGATLARAFTELGITVTYRGKEISVRTVPEQVSFLFDPPCLLEETPDSVTVTIKRKQPQRAQVLVQVKVAG